MVKQKPVADRMIMGTKKLKQIMDKELFSND